MPDGRWSRLVADALAPLREFNDSPLGVVLGSVLHTVGAIAFLGGLVAYLAWHRHLARGHHNRAVLDTAAVLTYLAIVVNLLGGFMRTFQTGHPHLTQFAESPWVRAIAVKHLFLFAAMGAAIYLLDRLAPRLVRLHRAERLDDPSPAGHRLAVAAVAVGVLVAAVLGATTQVVPLVSAEDTPEPPHTERHVAFHNATGQLMSTPLMPSTATGSFEVPNGTLHLAATLEWTPDQQELRLTLVAPDGTALAVTATGPGRAEATFDAPRAGAWTYEVGSDLAAGASWSLTLRMEPAADLHAPA